MQDGKGKFFDSGHCETSKSLLCIASRVSNNTDAHELDRAEPETKTLNQNLHQKTQN